MVWVQVTALVSLVAVDPSQVGDLVLDCEQDLVLDWERLIQVDHCPSGKHTRIKNKQR